MKTLIRYAFTLGLLPAAWLVAGCATCGSCQAQTATPQSHEAPPPPRVRDSFATPPTDAVPPPPAPPETPTAPAPPPAPAGKVKVTKTREVEGAAVVIEQTAAGTIYVGNTGVMPGPAQAAAQPALAMSYPLIPGPVPDAVVFSVSKRILGGLYYAVTGKCPAPKAATASGFATVPASYVTPASFVQMVPMAVAAQPAPVQQPQVVYMVAPQAAPPAPAQAPAPAFATEPMASPQAPRKSAWHVFRR